MIRRKGNDSWLMGRGNGPGKPSIQLKQTYIEEYRRKPHLASRQSPARSRDQGRAQFKKDPRVSLKTGKRIPDFLELPDISFLTNFNYNPPCNDTNSCAVWFCTSFLRGPVARLEKIYNPQDSNDDLDNQTLSLYANQQDKLLRILQVSTTSSDTSISDTAGVDFNQVAGQSSFATSVTIDGVSTSADPYSNSTNSTNGNGSFGERMRVVIGVLFAILLIVI